MTCKDRIFTLNNGVEISAFASLKGKTMPTPVLGYAAHSADADLIDIQQINSAYERVLRSDVKYRFVIDLASLHSERA